MTIVTFSGIDGSGKTTQINLVKSYLKINKIRFKVIHFVKNSIANKILKPQNTSLPPINQKNSQKRFCIFKIFLRKIALILDILLFRIQLLKNQNQVLLCDRYFYDYLINIYHLEKEDDPFVPPFILHLIPKPDLAFYLKIDSQKAWDRKKEQNLSYLKAKIKLFEKLKNTFKMNTILVKEKNLTNNYIIKQLVKLELIKHKQ